MPISASPSTPPTFDYASLDAATSAFIQEQTGEIRALMKRTSQDIIDLGQRLILVKEKLAYGQFGMWLAAEFDWTSRTAIRFMNVAEKFSFDNLSKLNFDPSALYELAAPSTPETARLEAIARAEAGEPITYSTAKAIRQKHTPNRAKRKRSVKQNLEIANSAPIQPVSQPETITQPLPQNEALVNPLPKREILAILPKRAASEIVAPQPEVVLPKAPLAKSNSIATGSWWQIAERHLLYCGSPNSGRFLERLPNQVSLQLAFPLERNNWLESVDLKIQSALCLWSSHKDEDQKLLLELVERALLLYTEGSDTIVFLFLPDPQLLMLAHGLECKCLIAEPDLQRCQKVIAAAQMKGMKPQRLKSVRF
jgi:hypothetical protein